jgi:hypothetical protein
MRLMVPSPHDRGNKERPLGQIINPRGTGGSGKTELARRILGEYGAAEPMFQAGRDRPIARRLHHPHGGGASTL